VTEVENKTAHECQSIRREQKYKWPSGTKDRARGQYRETGAAGQQSVEKGLKKMFG
jgi:hypothetical protein